MELPLAKLKITRKRLVQSMPILPTILILKMEDVMAYFENKTGMLHCAIPAANICRHDKTSAFHDEVLSHS